MNYKINKNLTEENIKDGQYEIALKINDIKTIILNFGNDSINIISTKVKNRIKQFSKESLIKIYQDVDNTFFLIIKKEDIYEYCELLLETLITPYHLNGKIIKLNISIGAAEVGKTKKTIFKNSIKALNECKSKKNSNGFVFFTKEIENKKEVEKYILLNFHESLKNGNIFIELQPKFDKNDYLVGAEALSRWKSKEYGYISPNDFIPILEKHNLTIDLTIFVINEVSKIINCIEPDNENDISFSINISNSIIKNKVYTERLESIILNSNNIGNYLEFEFLEHDNMDNKKTNSFIKKFKKYNIHFAIDDFGVGFSTFSYLIDLNVDIIKIDKSFIIDLDENSNEKKINIVKGMIDLAHSIKMTVVAEGVETKYQQILLKSFDVDQIQGFYYSKPLTIRKFKEKLYENNFILI